MANFDEDAVVEAVNRCTILFQPQLDDLKTQLSALSTKIDSLQLTHISPITITETFEDQTSNTYTRE